MSTTLSPSFPVGFYAIAHLAALLSYCRAFPGLQGVDLNNSTVDFKGVRLAVFALSPILGKASPGVSQRRGCQHRKPKLPRYSSAAVRIDVAPSTDWILYTSRASRRKPPPSGPVAERPGRGVPGLARGRLQSTPADRSAPGTTPLAVNLAPDDMMRRR
jgi:hypothetical protein